MVILDWSLAFLARFSGFAFVGMDFLLGEGVKVEKLCAVGTYSFAEEFGDLLALVLREEVGVFGLEVQIETGVGGEPLLAEAVVESLLRDHFAGCFLV